jgi:hypothetical protein
MDVPQKKVIERGGPNERNHSILQWDAEDRERLDKPFAEWSLHGTYFIYMSGLRLGDERTGGLGGRGEG